MLTGTALNYEETSGQLAKGLDNIFKQRNKEGKGLNQIDEFDPEQLGVISHTLEAMFGKEVGELSLLKDALDTKPFKELIDDIDRQLKAGVSAEKEKLLLETRRQAMVSKSADIMSQFSKNLSNSKTVSEALGKFGNQSKFFKDSLPTLGIKSKDSEGIAKETLMSAIDNLNAGLKNAGQELVKIDMKDIDRAFKSNDPQAIQDIMTQFSIGEKLLSTEQKSSLDELTSMKQTLQELNGTIRGFSQGLISNLLNSILGKVIIISATLLSVLAGILAIGGKLALFTAETINLFRGGEHLRGRYQKGLLEYIGIENRNNPKVKERLAAEELARKNGGDAATTAAGKAGKKGTAVATQDVAATATTKNVAASQDAATTAASKASRVAQKSGPVMSPDGKISKFRVRNTPEPRVSGLKGFLQRAHKWNSEAGEKISKFVEKTGTKITNSIDTTTKNILIHTDQGFVHTVKQSWIKTYEAMKFGAMKITEGAAFMGQQVKSAWQFIIPKIGEGIKTLRAGLNSGAENLITNIPNIGRGIATFVKNLRTNLVTGISKIPAIFNGTMSILTKGIGGTLSTLTKVGTRAGTAFAKFLGPVGIALIALEGFTTAMSTGARAAKIFEKESLKELSLNQEYAAKSAGLLMGLLNGVSFGLLGLILPLFGTSLESWTDEVAKFIAKVPILTVIFGTVVAALEVVWGVIKGVGLAIWEIAKGIGSAVWEIGKGLWDGIMLIINPITEGLTDVFSAIASIFSDKTTEGASSLVNAFRDLGGVVGIIAGPIQFIGKAIGGLISLIGTSIGWILRALGGIIGFVLKAVFKVIEGFTVFLEPFKEVFDAVGEAIGDIGTMFAELWTDLSYPLGAIGAVFEELGINFKAFFGSFGGDSKSFMEALKNIGWVLGKTVGIMLKVVLQPIILAIKIIGGLAKIISSVFKVLRGDFTGAGEMLKSAFGGIWQAITSPISYTLKTVIDTVTGIYDWFYKMYMWLVGGSIVPDLVNGIILWFSKLPEKIYSFLAAIPSLIGKALSKVGTYFESFGNQAGIFGSIISQIGNVLNFVGNSFANFSKFISGISDVMTGLLSFNITKIAGGLWKITDSITSQFKNWFSFLNKSIKNGTKLWGKLLGGLFSSIPKMINTGLKGLAGIGGYFADRVSEGLLFVGNGIVKFFTSLPKMIWNGLKALAKSFVDTVLSIPGMMWAGLKAIGETIYEASPEWLKKVFDGVLYIGTLFDKNIIQPMREFGGWVAGKFDDWFMNPLKTFGSWISGKFDEWFKKPLDDFVSYASKQWEDFTNFVGSVYGKLEGIVDTYIMQPFNNGILAIKNTFMSVINTIQDALEDMVNFFLRLVAWVPGSSMVAPKAKTPEQIQKERSIRDKKLKTSIYDGVLEKHHVLPKDLQLNNPVSPKINNIETMPSRAALITAPRETNTMPSRAALITRPNKTDKTTAESIKTLTEEATEKHSIYTHDTHVEKILNKLISNNSRTMTVESNIPLEKSIESEKTFNSIMDVSKNIFDIMSNPKELVNHITDIPKQIFGAITDAPKNIFNSITNPKDMLNTVSEASKQIFNNVFNKNKITEVPKQEFKITSNSSLNETNGFLYTLTKYSQVNNALQQGIISLLSKTDVASTVRNTPTDIEPNPDEIGNSYYYKQNLEKQNAAQTVLNVSPMVEDVSTAIQKDKVVSEPLKTEIVSSELSDIADDSSQQTALMQKFVNLLEDVKELLKPKTNITSSSGGYPGNTSSRQAVHNPPNYNRNTVGLVSQTPAKGALNLGQPVL